MKSVFLAILTGILIITTLLIVPDSVSAKSLSDSPSLNGCNPDLLDNLEMFVQEMGATADAYTTLGSHYLNCDHLDQAKQRYQQGIQLAKPDSLADLVARYGLVEIAFQEGEIDEVQNKTKTQEIAQKIARQLSSRSSLSLSSVASRGLISSSSCTCTNGYMVRGRCIKPCF